MCNTITNGYYGFRVCINLLSKLSRQRKREREFPPKSSWKPSKKPLKTIYLFSRHQRYSLTAMTQLKGHQDLAKRMGNSGQILILFHVPYLIMPNV